MGIRPLPFIPKGSFLDEVEVEDWGEAADSGLPGKRLLNRKWWRFSFADPAGPGLTPVENAE